MNNKALDLNQSTNWLKAGKVLIHPTESIWGLGCDALNESSIDLIFKLKKRPLNKNLILLVDSYFSIKDFVININPDQEKLLNEKWPGPYTFLFTYNKNLPSHLMNDTGKIAIRVSNHLPIKHLLEDYKGYMVSTSANFSGKPNINCPKKILKTFAKDDMAYYDESLGNQSKPSQIIDLETGIIIRQ